MASAAIAASLGLIGTASAMEEDKKGKGNKRIKIIHRPEGNKKNGQKMLLPFKAAKQHLKNHKFDKKVKKKEPPKPK
jgi:hypothetical protein